CIFIVIRQRNQILQLKQKFLQVPLAETEIITEKTAEEKMNIPQSSEASETPVQEKQKSSQPKRHDFLYIAVANKDVQLYTDTNLKLPAEMVKKDEVVGLLIVPDWHQLYKPMGDDMPVQIIYTDQYAAQKLEAGKNIEIIPGDIESVIKHMPRRYVAKGSIYLSGSLFHQLKKVA
ncbi:MAG TPA: hypothetical protein DCQ93_02900, partial [Bacteroidetes bacterium]|nr:hypothetical protein [Bacteroidota bacterium]